MELVVEGGYVFDPINGVRGERMDVAVKDGKIVDLAEVDRASAKVIDARGKVVMPGGVDMHTHVAGPKVNIGRLMRPEDHYASTMRAIPGVRRSGSGKTTPTSTVYGYKYARMGWTTLVEPATPPLKTRHTHEELDDIPIVDKACFPLVDSNWFVLEYLSKGDHERCAAFLAWLLNAVKGYALKIVDPGVAEMWSQGRGYGLDLDDQIPPRGITPRDIVVGLCKVNQMLKLPHTIHVHCNRLGIPGNYTTTLETMKALSGIGDGKNMHVTHAQFNSYAGEDWATLGTGTDRIAKYVNLHKHISLDMGQIVFGGVTTMTADAPFEFALFHMLPRHPPYTPVRKWAGGEVGMESASGVVPFMYKKSVLVNAIQWCIGLELALQVEDPWSVIMTTDHPNGGPFTRYPWIIAWLMSKKAREGVLEKINRRAHGRAILPTLDREYSLYDVAISTRAAPATLLGLERTKGHLGPGADADIAVYNIDPNRLVAEDYEPIIRAFRYASCTIKGGEVVVKDGKVVKTTYGKTFYVKHDWLEGELVKDVQKEVKEKFKEWYTVQMDNYVVGEHELRNPAPMRVG